MAPHSYGPAFLADIFQFVQVDYILELEGLGSLMRRWMKVPYLEFKKYSHQKSSWSCKWGIKQWWREAWGIDYESQVEIVKEKHTECDDMVDGIKVCYVLQYTSGFLVAIGKA